METRKAVSKEPAMPRITESAIEALALERIAALGYTCLYGPDSAPGDVVLARDTLLPKLMSGEVWV